ncbi:hypothetical protein [Terriglobus tenax]|uniref:hypothetical protein n=1 Tax=Terriglobus tenax TaxID=1111115 RepID=UPI0021DFC6D1|nr:hypothetical protein [Terriglobus tenax]
MQAEWSTETGAHDPVLVIPWQAEGTAHAFVDLREDPDALDSIPEADDHAALLHALRSLNAARSPVYTAKCDAWEMYDSELEMLQMEMLLEPDEAPCGFASYIDLLWRDRNAFLSPHKLTPLLDRLTRLAGKLEHPMAKLEFILRPAVTDFGMVQEGYAVTLYVKALGQDANEAYRHWADALGDVVVLLRSKDAAP